MEPGGVYHWGLLGKTWPKYSVKYYVESRTNDPYVCHMDRSQKESVEEKSRNRLRFEIV